MSLEEKVGAGVDVDGDTGRRPCDGGGIYGAEAPTSQGAPRTADRTRSWERRGRIVFRACNTQLHLHIGARLLAPMMVREQIPAVWSYSLCGDLSQLLQGPDTVGFQEADTEKGFLVQVTEGLLSNGGAGSRSAGARVQGWAQPDLPGEPWSAKCLQHLFGCGSGVNP